MPFAGLAGFIRGVGQRRHVDRGPANGPEQAREKLGAAAHWRGAVHLRELGLRRGMQAVELPDPGFASLGVAGIGHGLFLRAEGEALHAPRQPARLGGQNRDIAFCGGALVGGGVTGVGVAGTGAPSSLGAQPTISKTGYLMRPYALLLCA
jgi:hypothetical protein